MQSSTTISIGVASTYLNTDLPTGAAFPDGSASVHHGAGWRETSPSRPSGTPATAAPGTRQFEGFMENADLAFGILSTELWSPRDSRSDARGFRSWSRGLLEFAGSTLVSSRDWVDGDVRSEAARGVLAPWVLHTGLGPDQATSGFMTQVIGVALQLGGMPVPAGGGVKLVDALAGIVTRRGWRRSGPGGRSSRSSSRTDAPPAFAWRAARWWRQRALSSPT